MTIRLDRLMEIAVVGYIAVAVAQVMTSDSAAQVPSWLAALTRGMGG